MSLEEIVVINKEHSDMPNTRLRYALYLSEVEGERFYSVRAELFSGSESYFETAEDISRSREAAERFICLLAENDVEPCHIHDILYDMLPI